VIRLPVSVQNSAETTVLAPVVRNPSSGFYLATQFTVETSVDVIPAHPSTGIAFGSEEGVSLSSLEVRNSGGNTVSLHPDFSSEITTYNTTVVNGVFSIRVIPTVMDNTATVKVNGEAVTSGAASPAINLRVGDNTILVDVISQDGTIKKTYTIQVNRRPYIPQPSYYPVTGVSLSQTELILPVGKEPTVLQATVYPSYASNQSVTWSSSDPQVATVNELGMVTPLAPGTATITVTTVDQGKTATCQVKVVKAVELVGLKVSKKTILLKSNESSVFKLYAVYSDGTKEDITKDKKVKYRTSSKTKVTVTAGAVKAGKSEGRAMITITYLGMKAKIPVIISKLQVKKLELNPTSLRAEVDQVKQLQVTATLSNKTTQDVTGLATWSSSDPEVAAVDENGKLTAIAPGTAVIKATYGRKTSKMKVEVSQ
ncbi:MAG: Ig-like domain-containing protein, partial [Clostridia bacterium]